MSSGLGSEDSGLRVRFRVEGEGGLGFRVWG